MIKLFRKTRQNMIKENKVSKYMLYAIGEIVLVVIGILIALQINNSNEQRKINKQEIYILTQLQKEFKADSLLLNRYSWLSEKKVREGKILRKIIKNKIEAKEDSIVAMAFFNGKTILFKSYIPTFDEMVSSGNLDVIKSEVLKSKIKKFKKQLNQTQSFLYYESQRRKEAYNTHLFKYFEAEIMTHIWLNAEFRPISIKGLDAFETDIKGFFKDSETLYQINTIIGVDAELAFTYKKNNLPAIQDILIEIQLEIDKTND